ncbi:hypothetical protein BGW38_003847 [Lunasporangiospora selenospora]|uniref:Uncharacterized protein n=1 Tax=Lunasporangiospora selenospora TaxID=979761 RepID=A0A9P6G075_9FUNG|nr:hypothetical protein BGW38_003847 [Lunasporangiospora selenospora]
MGEYDIPTTATASTTHSTNSTKASRTADSSSDMAPQLLPSQTLFQDPTRLQSYLENTQQQQQQQLGSIRIPHDPTNGNGNNAVHNGPGVIDSNRPILQSNVGVGALTPNAMAIYQQHMQMAYQRQQQQQPQQQQQQQATQHLQHLQQQQQK